MVIESGHLIYTGHLIVKALDRVSERARLLLTLLYFWGYTLTSAAAIAGYPTTQAAEQAHYTALRQIRRSSAAQELHELLSDFGEFDIVSESMKGVGARRFAESWESATERTAIKHIELGSRFDESRSNKNP